MVAVVHITQHSQAVARSNGTAAHIKAARDILSELPRAKTLVRKAKFQVKTP
jgi:hypothetical protein